MLTCSSRDSREGQLRVVENCILAFYILGSNLHTRRIESQSTITRKSRRVEEVVIGMFWSLGYGDALDTSYNAELGICTDGLISSLAQKGLVQCCNNILLAYSLHIRNYDEFKVTGCYFLDSAISVSNLCLQCRSEILHGSTLIYFGRNINQLHRLWLLILYISHIHLCLVEYIVTAIGCEVKIEVCTLNRNTQIFLGRSQSFSTSNLSYNICCIVTIVGYGYGYLGAIHLS